MGNDSAKMNCPIHKDERIKYVCTEKKCLQPLCEQCSKIHKANHQKLGFSPSFISISQIVSEHDRYDKLNQQIMKKSNQISVKDGQYIPTGYLLKSFTRQYFSKKFSQNKRNESSNRNLKNSRENHRFQYENDSKSRSLPTFDFSIQQQKKKRKMVKILTEYQIYHKMKNNKEIKGKILQFFKKNLVLNQGVVGKDFSHLYQ